MSDPFDLSGKTAVITGSSRGIGKAIAEALAARGASVVISSRKQPACDAVADAINALGAGRAIAVSANIASKAELQRLVSTAEVTFGQVDIVICNAATNPYFGPLQDISDEQFEKILHNNILSNHWLVQMTAPAMRARRDGSIIIVSSIGGYRGSASLGAYNIAKAGDFQLARNLAVEFGPDNVRVNCIAPGLIRTDFARALWDDEDNLKRSLRGTPLSRIGEPEDVAGAAVFLASPAGCFVTGQTIVVDGGATVTLGGI
jgi:NAD(P)-dependent dehydrogenase (short-subunit alcohol dehydrogenase family)